MKLPRRPTTVSFFALACKTCLGRSLLLLQLTAAAAQSDLIAILSFFQLPLIARLLLADYLCGGGGVAAAFFAPGAQITPHYRFDRAFARLS
jgi:hypothetical protein